MLLDKIYNLVYDIIHSYLLNYVCVTFTDLQSPTKI